MVVQPDDHLVARNVQYDRSMLHLLTLASVALMGAGAQGDTARITTIAVRAARPPVIDGRDNDDIWRQAPPITEFTEWRPRRVRLRASRPKRRSPMTRRTCTCSS